MIFGRRFDAVRGYTPFGSPPKAGLASNSKPFPPDLERLRARPAGARRRAVVDCGLGRAIGCGSGGFVRLVTRRPDRAGDAPPRPADARGSSRHLPRWFVFPSEELDTLAGAG